MPEFEKKTRGFKLPGYSAFDKGYNSPKKQMMPEETMNTAFYQKEKKDIQIEKKPTVSNLSEQLKEMGVTEKQVMNWANKNIPWFESGDWGDQYDDNDILKWGRQLSKDLYEGNVDEID